MISFKVFLERHGYDNDLELQEDAQGYVVVDSANPTKENKKELKPNENECIEQFHPIKLRFSAMIEEANYVDINAAKNQSKDSSRGCMYHNGFHFYVTFISC